MSVSNSNGGGVKTIRDAMMRQRARCEAMKTSLRDATSNERELLDDCLGEISACMQRVSDHAGGGSGSDQTKTLHDLARQVQSWAQREAKRTEAREKRLERLTAAVDELMREAINEVNDISASAAPMIAAAVAGGARSDSVSGGGGSDASATAPGAVATSVDDSTSAPSGVLSATLFRLYSYDDGTDIDALLSKKRGKNTGATGAAKAGGAAAGRKRAAPASKAAAAAKAKRAPVATKTRAKKAAAAPKKPRKGAVS